MNESVGTAHARDAAVPAHQEPASGHSAVLPDGGLLRAVLRGRAPRRRAARHHPHGARPVGRSAHPHGGRALSTPWTAISRDWSARARASRSASRRATRPAPGARSSARWCASSPPAPSPMPRSSRSGATRWSRRWRVTLRAFGLAWLDLAAGRFTVLQAEGRGALAAELERLKPAELLIAEGDGAEVGRPGTALRTRPPWHFELASASRLLTDQLGTLDLKGFGADDLPLAIRAAGALLQYVRDTQRAALPHIRGLARRGAWRRPHSRRGEPPQPGAGCQPRRQRGRDAARASSTRASPPWDRASCVAGSTARSPATPCCEAVTRRSALCWTRAAS